MSENQEELQPEEMQSEELRSNSGKNGAAEDEATTAESVEAPSEAPAEPTERAEADAETQFQQQLLRVHADFDNFRKRTRQEKEELQKFANRRIFEELLPVLDNFERALPALVDATPEIRQGMEMVHRQLAAVLEGNGVTTMDPVGQPFDPRYHEAVMQEPASELESGTVLEVLQKGYTLHDKVLRPAMVKVAE